MIDVGDLVSPEGVFLNMKVSSKRQLFQEVAATVERSLGIEQAVTLAALIQREKLGTTGIGDGIAVPHARLKGLGSLTGLFARLARPVDYDALDDEPVDLVFVVLAPEAGNADQLKALARIARLMRDPAVAVELRTATDKGRVAEILHGETGAAGG